MSACRLSLVAVAGLVGVALLSSAQDDPAQLKGVEVLARGPVHEGFAEPVSDQPMQGAVVAKRPPDPIEEMPPDERPAGDNVQWLPGYWAWDADQKDYLWVSGFWRVPPPSRHWAPGHWQETDQGWLWISGFWAPDNLQQVQYLPPPPPSVEAGPPTPAPDPASTYVAGCWVYQGRYLWRPGYWIAYRPGWVWIPAHYVWTPVGCLFVEGYWDRPLDYRGLVFAPVRFDLNVWLAARRPFVPAFVVQTDFLLGALFVGPHARHYYFGDYFDDAFVKRGFTAWIDYHPRKGMIDPNFAYYRHVHAGEGGWDASLRELYVARRSGAVPRPPQTLVQQTQIINNITVNKTVNVAVSNKINLTHVQNVTAIAPLTQVKNLNVTALGGLSPAAKTAVQPHVVKVEPVPKADHVREQKVATQIRDFAVQRQQTEAKLLQSGGNPLKHTDAPNPIKLTLPPPVPHVGNAPPAAKIAAPPPLPKAPPHVEQAIPKYEPPHPPLAPKKDNKDKKDKK